MKAAFSVLFAIIFTCQASAQNSMLAGKIVDENDMPIAGATIKVGRAHHGVQTSSDSDGLFYTRLLPAGNYHITIRTSGKYLRTKTVYLPDETKKKSFYYLKIVGDRVRVTVDGQDPFLKAKLTKLTQDQRHIMDGRKMFILKIDTTTHKVIGTSNYYHIPRVGEAR